MDTIESDCGCMNMRHGSMVAMRSMKSMVGRRGRKFVCQGRRYRTDGPGRGVGLIGQGG